MASRENSGTFDFEKMLDGLQWRYEIVFWLLLAIPIFIFLQKLSPQTLLSFILAVFAQIIATQAYRAGRRLEICRRNIKPLSGVEDYPKLESFMLECKTQTKKVSTIVNWTSFGLFMMTAGYLVNGSRSILLADLIAIVAVTFCGYFFYRTMEAIEAL